MKRIMVATLMGFLAVILILADSFGGSPSSCWAFFA